MSDPTPPNALELASLLCSRLCHDAIGPVGAIMNGLELLEDEGGAEMRELAIGLIRRSAVKAVATLEFARLAYGAGGGRSHVDLRELERVVGAVFESERPDVTFLPIRGELPLIEAKLLLNLVRFAGAAIPRGGTLTVSATSAAGERRLSVVARGPGARTPEAARIAIGGANDAGYDPHNVQAWLIHLLARDAGLSVAVEAGDDEVRFDAG